MSLFRHIFVLFFIFATHPIAKSEDGTHRSTRSTKVDPALDVAAFNFSRDIGSFKLEISMKNDKCGNDKTKEQGTNAPGSKEIPAESCEDVDGTKNYYIKSRGISDQAFKVKCNVEKKSTCLLINSIIEESSINNTAITMGDQIWLSQTDFDVNLLYNNIKGDTGTNRAQISLLLSTSTSVYQKVKYYYSTALSNGTFIKTGDNKVGSLKALLWNDHLVGSKITKRLPMQFTFSNTEPCWSGSDWMCSNIIFQDNSNKRLPVTDFYIEDVRAKPDGPTQKIYFGLVDLCFSYD